MAKAKKIKKPRTTKYDKKFAVNGSFADVFKVVKKNKEDKQTKRLKSSILPLYQSTIISSPITYVVAKVIVTILLMGALLITIGRMGETIHDIEIDE